MNQVILYHKILYLCYSMATNGAWCLKSSLFLRTKIFMWNLPRDVHVGSAWHGGAHGECWRTWWWWFKEGGTKTGKTSIQGWS